MIELYDIIAAADKFVHSTKGTLVLHRSMKEHPKFKVYKRYCYDLYLVKGKDKNNLLSWEKVKNSPSENILEDWKESDKEFLPILIEWLSSKHFNELKDGI